MKVEEMENKVHPVKTTMLEGEYRLILDAIAVYTKNIRVIFDSDLDETISNDSKERKLAMCSTLTRHINAILTEQVNSKHLDDTYTDEEIAEIEEYIDFLKNKVSEIKEDNNESEERKLQVV